METYLEKAIAYVRDNIDMDRVSYVRGRMYLRRTPLNCEDCALSDEIHDLMEEYSEDNDLNEGWWLEEVDEDDIIMRL